MRRLAAALVLAIALATLAATEAAAAPVSYLVRSDEIETLAEPLHPGAPAPKLVLIDLDRTLWQQKTVLGSETWFARLERQFGTEFAYRMWDVVSPHVSVELVEAKVLRQVIKRLRKRGVTVVGLTAQGERMVDTVVARLEALGIELGGPGLDGSPTTLGGKYPYAGGVVFSNTSPEKPAALAAFRQERGGDIDLTHGIVMADDRPANLRGVAAWCRAEGINFRGIEYTRAAFHERRYARPEYRQIAELQLVELMTNGVIPSDAKARWKLRDGKVRSATRRQFRAILAANGAPAPKAKPATSSTKRAARRPSRTAEPRM